MIISTGRLLKCAAAAAFCCSAVLAQEQVQPAGQPQAVPAAQPQPAFQGGAGGDWGDAAGAPGGAAADARNVLRRGVDLSAPALASAPYLYAEGDAKVYLGGARLEQVKDNMAYQKFERALVKIADKGNYKAGDTVFVVSKEKRIIFKGKPEHIVSRKGRAVIEEFVGEKKLVIRLVDMWGVISGGESIVPLVPFNSIRYVDVAAPDTKIEASVVVRLSETVTPYLHQFVIIDKGSDGGVRLGDFFMFKENKPADELSEALLEGQVVNVTPSSATLVVQKIYKTGLNTGDHAYLSHRLPRQE